MKYACIGEHLKHSFSKEIHNALADYEYEIREIPREELGAFMTEKNFFGINVTIPYKEAVIPYLYETDDAAKAIGAVNTIVNKNGRLYGYNTDFYGMSELFRHAGISAHGKKAAILGSGGTAKTARAVLSSLGASSILTVSRNAACDTISYDELYEKHSDTEIIVNTTPVGMFPNTEASPIDISGFKKLSGVIDAIYNPLRSKLISDAENLKIPAEGGLYMLVAQALRASELFLDKAYSPKTLDEVYERTLAQKENIVLIGMPSSGKSTIGALLSSSLSRRFIDSDEEIVKKHGAITEIFKNEGEAAFRDYESTVIKELSQLTGVIIATGGGAILREENVKALKKNGKLIFLDRALEDLTPTDSRPLSQDKEAMKRRYEERYPIYVAAADLKVRVSGEAPLLSEKIKEMLSL